jgi:type IV pilus assembly protein PilN
MITVNLLRRTLANEQRHRRRCQVEATVLVFVLVSFTVVCGIVWWDLDHSRNHLQIVKEQKAIQLGEMKRLHAQIEKLNVQARSLLKRSHEVARLSAQQRQSIRLLDVVSESLNPLRIWLASLQMEKGNVILRGYTESKDQIVEFADLLKRDEIFQDVAILETGLASEDFSGYEFSMNLRLSKAWNHVTTS